MTLNLWQYYDWAARKQNLLDLVHEQQPDVIALQEVQLNHAFSYSPASDYIADNCNYAYRVFAPTYAQNGQIDMQGEATQRTSYGLALLSKHPIVSAETHFLQQYPDFDEECSVLFCTVNIEGTLHQFCNVHLANTDKHSQLHLTELLDVCAKRNQQPILLGDFNNFDLGQFKPTLLQGYMVSTDVASYISIPKNNGTLDYVAVPAATYEITKIICPDTYVSDHRAVVATIAQKH